MKCKTSLESKTKPEKKVSVIEYATGVNLERYSSIMTKALYPLTEKPTEEELRLLTDTSNKFLDFVLKTYDPEENNEETSLKGIDKETGYSAPDLSKSRLSVYIRHIPRIIEMYHVPISLEKVEEIRKKYNIPQEK